MKDLFALLVAYSVGLVPMSFIPQFRGFSGRGMVFCAVAFFLIYWGFLAVLSMKAWGFLGAVLCLVLTAAGMAPVQILWQAFQVHWNIVGILVVGILWIAFLGGYRMAHFFLTLCF